MARKDRYYNQSKQEGYRSRAAYKLKQLDDAESLLPDDGIVVDLGAAPGGWLQIAAGRVGDAGTVLGVDRQRIDPIDGVETIRGDITDETVKAEIVDRVGSADVVLSDMAPDVSGEYGLDHARSIHLAGQALQVALEVLRGGGDLVVKVFEGPDLDGLRTDLEAEFDYVRGTRPDATRSSSSELYLIGKGRLTAPVRVGDELTVDVTDIGGEGDGIASIDGFTVFVPDTAIGDRVPIRVVDVKPRFGFAERIDD